MDKKIEKTIYTKCGTFTTYEKEGNTSYTPPRKSSQIPFEAAENKRVEMWVVISFLVVCAIIYGIVSLLN